MIICKRLLWVSFIAFGTSGCIGGLQATKFAATKVISQSLPQPSPALAGPAAVNAPLVDPQIERTPATMPITTPIQTPPPAAVPAPPPTVGNPGAFETYAPWVLYDPAHDSAATCNPFFDSQIQPIAFSGAKAGSAWVTMNVISLNGTNYQINGTLAANNLSFNQSLHVNCNSPSLTSALNSNATAIQGGQWITGAFKINQMDVVGVVHNEYYGGGFPQNQTWTSRPLCANPGSCLSSAVETAISNDGGSSYQTPVVIARPGFSFDAGFLGAVWNGITSTWSKTTGYFVNSNIVIGTDGAYYMMMVEDMPDGSSRICPSKNHDITQPTQWRAWDGINYSINTSAGADCIGVASPIAPFYIGYNQYFQSYIVVGTLVNAGQNNNFAYAISPDLIHWSEAIDLGISPTWRVNAMGWGNFNFPTLIDPAYLLNISDMNQSSGAVTGQNPWLVYVDQFGQSGQGSRILAQQLHFSATPQPIPQITEVGLGCENLNCGWVKGTGFTGPCQVNVIPPDGSPAIAVSNVNCMADNYVTFVIPPALQSQYPSLLVSVTNAYGLWSAPASLNISPGEPTVSSAGVGCTDGHCLWINGNNFSDQCQVTLYSNDWVPLGLAPDTTCNKTMVTLRVPSSVYAGGIPGVRVVITNVAGVWSTPYYVPLY